MGFALAYGEVELILSQMNEVQPRQLGAFRSRLRHLQKLGFPPGINTGKGRPAVYGAGQIMLLALALELIQLGVTPDRAAGLLRDKRDSVAGATALAMRRIGKEAVFLVVDPVVLGSGEMIFGHFTLTKLHSLLDKIQTSPRLTRLALINVTAILKWVNGWLYDFKPESLPDFQDGLGEWASGVEGD